MTWDDLLERLRLAGLHPEELDFMENYGPIAAERHKELEGRHLRCVFGTVRLNGNLKFDVYFFPSPDDAEDFARVMGARRGWQQAGNMVFGTEPEDRERLRKTLEVPLQAV
jgi:hypothetical protein